MILSYSGFEVFDFSNLGNHLVKDGSIPDPFDRITGCVGRRKAMDVLLKSRSLTRSV